ncbi:hypothetical protein Tco_1213048 [Tanacetum coccineum]
MMKLSILRKLITMMNKKSVKFLDTFYKFLDMAYSSLWIRRIDFLYSFVLAERKEIDDVGEVSTIWKSESVGVLKLQDGCSTRILAY